MTDGAHLGISADRALKTILGGQPSPRPDEQMAPIEFRDWILAPDEEPYDYGECARRVARSILGYYMADPRRATIPTETVYEEPTDWKDPVVKEIGLYERMQADSVEIEGGITGFQWGWAVNAARRCVELPPVPNPAIIEIGS